jgi:hypothetical protein
MGDCHARFCESPRVKSPRATHLSKTPKPPLLLACLALTLCFALLAAGRASAAVPSFGASGRGAGEFEEPRGIAINQGSEEVFVADRKNARVDAFTASGAFLRAFGWGVASDKEELQTCTTHCSFGYEGPGIGELVQPEGVAVDNDLMSASFGDVYVGEQIVSHRVQKFTASGEFLLMFGGGVNATKVKEAEEQQAKGGPVTVSEAEENVCTAISGDTCTEGTTGKGDGQFEQTYGVVTVGPEGNVFAGDLERVQEFTPEGVYMGQLDLPSAGYVTALAVDSAGDIYVKGSELLGVHEYELAAKPAAKEPSAPRDEAGSPGPIAIGPSIGPSNTLLVADNGSGHILQYSAAGVQLKSFGAGTVGESTSGIAYDTATNAVYVLNSSAVDVVPIPPPGPLVISQSAEEVKPTAANLAAIVNPESPEATKYHFEYGTTAAYNASTPEGVLSTGFEDQSVPPAAIGALQPGTTYHFRVVVTNAAHETFGPDETFTTLPPVAIDSESASHVTAFSARFEGELNPHGSATAYHFEYGPTTAYETSVPVPDASAGGGTEDTTVIVPIQNLNSGTTYHYRLVARNGFGESRGPDQTFTTQSASETALIDGRAWEQVTPQSKQGTTIEAIAKEGDVIQAAADGHALTYGASSPITTEPQGNRSIADSQVLSTRTSPGAWSTQDIATKHEEVAGLVVGEPSEYQLFSPNLEAAFVEPSGATPLSAQASERTPYRREADGSFTPLLTAANVQAGVKFGGEQVEESGQIIAGRSALGSSPKFIAATPDGSHVLVSSSQPLTAGVKFVENGFSIGNLYEWSDGALQLASMLPSGAPASSEGGASFESSGGFVRHALSDAGDRVEFAVGSKHLYLRDMKLGQTIQLDTPEAGMGEEGDDAAIFQTADTDDSRIFFLDQARLTGDATARLGEPDLYECEVTSTNDVLECKLKDLTVDANLGESANVLGVAVGADETGRYVYFVANGRLAPGAVSGDCPAQELAATETQCNLYVRDTLAGGTRLVAVLSGADFHDWRPSEAATDSDLGNVTSRVSPDGQYLAFMSERPLTGFDNRDTKSGQRDQEVFEYSYGANTLTCVGCASSGARPEGVFDPNEFPGLLVDRPDLWHGRWLASSIPGWTLKSRALALYQSRYLANSGRLFFNSATPLVPSDGNGLEDVYEYEPSGVGSCGLSSGCVGLISSGGSSEESAFLDASETGDDVFFLTSAQLSKSDTDTAYDIYDAHVCSSESPCGAEAAATPPPCGTADSCRAASAPQPDIAAAPASQTFSGSGNVTPASKAAVKTKALTRAQKLTKALKVCRVKKNKRKRQACVRHARKEFGQSKKAKK